MSLSLVFARSKMEEYPSVSAICDDFYWSNELLQITDGNGQHITPRFDVSEFELTVIIGRYGRELRVCAASKKIETDAVCCSGFPFL